VKARSSWFASIIALAVGSAAPVSIAIAAEDWDHDWTVVTMARNGSWGVGIDYPIAGAIAAAKCRAMSGGVSDCGAAFAATRGGWIIGVRCGDYRILATGEDLKDAEATALDREIDLKRLYVPDLPACQCVLTVDPRGAVTTASARLSGRQ
jgi:hypothetical protein